GANATDAATAPDGPTLPDFGRWVRRSRMVGMPGDSRGLRLSVIGIVVFSLFVALFGRLWYLQVVQSDQLAQVASANQVRTVPLAPMRGRILDRDGRILADNDSTLNVTIDRSAIKDKTVRTALFDRLAG